MKCPFCHHPDTLVIETREVEDGAALRRRRRCPHCDKRFTTYEHAELNFPRVVKKDGSRVDYQPEKLRESLRLALRKRPVATEAVDTAVSRIEDQLRQYAGGEVLTSQIGEWVMAELRGLDPVAFVRFASVYRSFQNPDEFLQLVREMQPPPAPRRGKGSER